MRLLSRNQTLSTVDFGVEENIFTACNECHKEHDEGENQLLMQSKARNYLASKYDNWDVKNLIYDKYKIKED